jgi:hypothetical protein
MASLLDLELGTQFVPTERSVNPLVDLGKSVARGVPQAVTGFVDLAALPFTLSGLLEPKNVVGSTDYLTARGFLPQPSQNLLGQTTELLSSAVTPAGVAKTFTTLAKPPVLTKLGQSVEAPTGILNEKPAFTTRKSGGILEIEPTGSQGIAQQTFGTVPTEGIYPGTAISSRGVGQSVYGIDEQEANRQVQSLLTNPETNRAFQLASTITQTQGRAYNPLIDIPPSSLAKQSGIGRTYQIAAEMPQNYPKDQVFQSYLADPEYAPIIKQLGINNYDDLVEASYKQLEKETQEQFKSLPVKMSFHEGNLNYNDSQEMLRDIIGHNHLTVFRGGDKHEFLNKVDKTTGLNSNEQFRAVHDYFGHAVRGNPFGAKGEEIAWASHEQMYSPLAKIAMTSETRGQNSFVNYTPVNAELYSQMEDLRKLQQEAKARGDADSVKLLADELKKKGDMWGYAKQAAILLPAEYTKPQFAGGMPDYLINALEPKFGVEETLTHFSNKPDLDVLDPTKYGSGIKGQEARRLAETINPVTGRSYAYRGAAEQVTPEPGLGRYPYQMQVPGLYDITKDPEQLGLLAAARNTTSYLSPYNRGLLDPQQSLTDLERLTREYGYRGLLDPTKAILFNPTPVR